MQQDEAEAAAAAAQRAAVVEAARRKQFLQQGAARGLRAAAALAEVDAVRKAQLLAEQQAEAAAEAAEAAFIRARDAAIKVHNIERSCRVIKGIINVQPGWPSNQCSQSCICSHWAKRDCASRGPPEDGKAIGSLGMPDHCSRI